MQNKLQLIREIKDLKKKHNAIILAHYYEDSDIQDIADHVGDSLYLAQIGEKSTAPVVLLAGVVFMAESVKILSPNKIVLAPDLNAGCSLVDGSPYEQYMTWKNSHPGSVLISYINCSAEVKGISDIICTSSNAEKIVNSIPRNIPILFGPDENLGRFLSKKLNRPMTLWPGSCEVHVLFSSKKIFHLKKQHPEALVLAHPECHEAVLDEAHVVGSTSKLLLESQNQEIKKFIVATEPGIIHQMKKNRPDALFFEAPAEGSCTCNECPYMKLNTLEKMKMAFENLSPQIEVPIYTLKAAHRSLKRMLDLTNDLPVDWVQIIKSQHRSQPPNLT